MKIHHVGYLVEDVKIASEQFHALGFVEVSEITYDAYRGMDFLFMENDGYRIELVSPKHEKAEMWKQLKKRGAMPYHICYVVNKLEKCLENMVNNSNGGGYRILHPPMEASAIGNRRVTFLYNNEIGIVELLENNDNT